ncbi:MAG: hypothetical protein OEW37_02945 [Rhodospirillaceae bacterium]|nr:hypothetical protein [Rhodospirillaceae bacterium]
MSYILDALKKSDQERKRGEVPTITSASADVEFKENETKQISLKIAAGGFVLSAIIVTVVLFMPSDEEPSSVKAAPEAATEMALTPSAPDATPANDVAPSERATAPQPAPKPAPKPAPIISQEVKTEIKPPEISPERTPEKPSPIIAADPVNADIPKPDASTNEAPAPASQPINKVSVAPEPKRVPGSTVARVPTLAAKIETKTQIQKLKPSLPMLNSASDYLDRGWNSMNLGLFNQAIADFSVAVEMEPGFADGWFALGWAQEKNNQDGNAIASYSNSIKAKANHAGALFSRGYLELFSGKPLNATRDFKATLNLAENDFRLYIHVWTFVAKNKSGSKTIIDSIKDLKIDSQDDELSSWPGQIIRYYMGELTEAQILQAIEDGSSSGLQERRCAGYFFIGEYALLKGDTKKARNYFEKSLATGVVKLRQFDASRRELASLAQ